MCFGRELLAVSAGNLAWRRRWRNIQSTCPGSWYERPGCDKYFDDLWCTLNYYRMNLRVYQTRRCGFECSCLHVLYIVTTDHNALSSLTNTRICREARGQNSCADLTAAKELELRPHLAFPLAQWWLNCQTIFVRWCSLLLQNASDIFRCSGICTWCTQATCHYMPLDPNTTI